MPNEAQKPDSETLKPSWLADEIAANSFKHMPRYGWGEQTTDEVHGAIQTAAAEAIAAWNRRASIPAERGEAVAISETLNFYISDSEDGISRVPRLKLVELQQSLAAMEAVVDRLRQERDEALAEVARYWTSADMKPWVELSESKGLGHFGKKLKGMFSRAMKAEGEVYALSQEVEVAEARATSAESLLSYKDRRIAGLEEALKKAREWLACVEQPLCDTTVFKRELAQFDALLAPSSALSKEPK